jgi:hypothetical protein
MQVSIESIFLDLSTWSSILLIRFTGFHSRRSLPLLAPSLVLFPHHSGKVAHDVSSFQSFTSFSVSYSFRVTFSHYYDVLVDLSRCFTVPCPWKARKITYSRLTLKRRFLVNTSLSHLSTSLFLIEILSLKTEVFSFRSYDNQWFELST